MESRALLDWFYNVATVRLAGINEAAKRGWGEFQILTATILRKQIHLLLIGAEKTKVIIIKCSLPLVLR